MDAPLVDQRNITTWTDNASGNTIVEFPVELRLHGWRLEWHEPETGPCRLVVEWSNPKKAPALPMCRKVWIGLGNALFRAAGARSW